MSFQTGDERRPRRVDDAVPEPMVLPDRPRMDIGAEPPPEEFVAYMPIEHGIAKDVPPIDRAVVALGPSRRLADLEDEGWRPAHRRALRLALAMRGGVSLAVWIGGAVAEIDVLRSIRIMRDPQGDEVVVVLRCDDEPLTPGLTARVETYAQLLAGRGADRVDVDILAGASAGGLNSVIYAAAQRAGRPIDDLKDTWRDVGGLAELMHPPGFARVTSLLRGDGYFWPSVRDALVRLHTAERFHPDLVPRHISVDLSATLIDSEDALDPDTREGRGDFHFASLDDGGQVASDGDAEPHGDALAAVTASAAVGNRIPSRDPDSTTPSAHTLDDLDRLAYAARTTSSFPGAFEPATIYSSVGGAELAATPRPNMRFAFGAHRETDDTPYRVIDGGVFDNIPITRALGAVKTRASTTASERMLLYLDPSPALDPGVGVVYEEGRARLSNAVLGAVSRRFRHETEGGELEELDRFVQDVGLATGRWESFATLSRAPWDAAARAERISAYTRYRYSSDVNLLVETLSFPARAQLGWESASRGAWRGIERDAADALRGQALFAYNRRSWGVAAEGSSSVVRGPQGLLDAAQCVLSAVQWLEQATHYAEEPKWSQDQQRDQQAARALAYGVIGVATGMRDEALARVLDAVAASGSSRDSAGLADLVVDTWLEPLDDTSLIDRAWVRLDRAWRSLAPSYARMRTQVETTDPALIADAEQRWSERAGSGSDPGLLAVLWRECPWRGLVEADLGPEDAVGAADLPPLFAATGMPPVVTHATYTRIDGHSGAGALAAASGLEEVVAALREKDRTRRVATALDDPHLTLRRAREHLHSGAEIVPAPVKLAGTRLANFSGFLSSSWRENDWWWGRLDAAAGLDRALGGASGAQVQSAIVSDLRAEHEAAAETGAPRLDGGLDEIGSLDPDYIAGLAGRGVRVLSRALPTPDSALGTAVVRVVAWLLRPVTVLVPAAVDPPRIAFVGGMLLILATALSWPTAAFPTSGAVVWPHDAVILIAAVVALALAARGISSATTRWRRVMSADEDPPDLRSWRASALRSAGVVFAGSAVAVIPLAVAVRMGAWLPAGVWALAVVLGGYLVGRAALRVGAGSGGTRAVRWAPTIAAGLMLLGGVVVGIAGLAGAPWAAVPAAGGVGWSAGWVAGAGAAIGVALLWGWQRAWFTVLAALAAVGLGAASALLVAWLAGPPALAWIAGIVVWGNVLWLAPETGWGAKALDDTPRVRSAGTTRP
ncbi:hypothetical protein GCM10022200_30620 [Microbacterium awajiense]|uniref:PNPLA domain-containing protein n=1 Tax=Microbacterium awajiense TaxID=415214 RepID=A0ABP7AZL8_9MICO